MPQWARSLCVSRHEPPQSVSPAPQETTQRPALHTCPLAQEVPHMPQWARSLCTSAHTPGPRLSPPHAV